MATRGLLFLAEKCTGCRSCELACSFAHQGAHQPASAGLTVLMERATGAVALSFTATCDLCAERAGCACVEYCAPGALKVEQ